MSFNKSRKETMMRPGGELEVVQEEVEEEEEEEEEGKEAAEHLL